MSEAQLGLLSARITALEDRLGKVEAQNKLLSAIAKGVVSPSRLARIDAKMSALEKGILDLFKSDDELSKINQTVTKAITTDVEAIREAVINQAGNLAAVMVAMVDKEVITQDEMTKWMTKSSVWMDQEMARRRDEFLTEEGEEKVRAQFKEAGIPDKDVEKLVEEWKQEIRGNLGNTLDADGGEG